MANESRINSQKNRNVLSLVPDLLFWVQKSLSSDDMIKKFIYDLETINHAYNTLIECRKNKAYFKGVITYSRVPGKILKEIKLFLDNNKYFLDNENITDDEIKNFFIKKKELFIIFIKFLNFFLNWQDRIINIYGKNLFEYSNKILDSVKKEIEDRKCIIETNHVGLNKQENSVNSESIPANKIKIAIEGRARNNTEGNGKSLRQRRNENRTRRENRSRPVLGTSLNGNSRRGNNGNSRRGNNGNNTSQRISL
jgi:hypothetical protein